VLGLCVCTVMPCTLVLNLPLHIIGDILHSISNVSYNNVFYSEIHFRIAFVCSFNCWIFPVIRDVCVCVCVCVCVFVCVCGTGDWTWDHMHAKYRLYHGAIFPAPKDTFKKVKQYLPLSKVFLFVE
jgi:hypothetical protein